MIKQALAAHIQLLFVCFLKLRTMTDPRVTTNNCERGHPLYSPPKDFMIRGRLEKRRRKSGGLNELGGGAILCHGPFLTLEASNPSSAKNKYMYGCHLVVIWVIDWSGGSPSYRGVTLTGQGALTSAFWTLDRCALPHC